MAAWKYIKGSEKDFEGAPEWATCKCYCSFNETEINDDLAWCEGVFKGAKWLDVYDEEVTQHMDQPEQWHLIAQRERVTSINDDRLAQGVAAVKTLEMSGYTYHGGKLWKPPLGKAPDYVNDDNLNPKYNRPCKGVTIDVYDVLQAFNVTNPALQHLVKKALAVGQRGHKDKMEDLCDILASAQRAIELEEMSK